MIVDRPVLTSPCTGVCKYHATDKMCMGCGRTGAEITRWSGLSVDDRTRVWEDLPSRLNQMGISLRRPNWSSDDVRAILAAALQTPETRWRVAGRNVHFPGDTRVTIVGQRVTATWSAGVLHADITSSVRALIWQSPDTTTGPVLVLARPGTATPVREFIELQSDSDTVDKEETLATTTHTIIAQAVRAVPPSLKALAITVLPAEINLLS